MLNESLAAFWKIERKRTASLAMLVLAAMLITASVSSYLSFSLQRYEENRFVGTIAAILSETVSRMTLSGDQQTQGLLEDLQKRLPELAYIVLENPGKKANTPGEPLTVSQKGAEDQLQLIKASCSQSLATSERDVGGVPVREVLLPVGGGGERVGDRLMRVGVKVQETRKQQQFNLLVHISLILCLTVLAGVAMERLLRRFGLRLSESELARRTSEERLKFLVKHSSDSLVVVDSTGNQQYVSEGAEKITGYPVEELQGKTLDKLIHPEDIGLIQKAWDEALQHPEKTVTVQYRHIHKTREWVFSEAIAQNFFAEPAINGIIASVRDITEHKKSEAELQLSRYHLRLFVDASPDLCYLKDASLRYLMVNAACLQFFQRSEDEILGKTDEEIQFDEAVLRLTATDKRAMLERRRIVVQHEVADKVIECCKLPVLIDEKLYGVAGILRDMTESTRAEEEKRNLQIQLTQSQKLESIGRLAGGVAHDFNNMLGVILGHAEMALTHTDPSYPWYSSLMEISKAAKRSADLTQQLLAFARKQAVAPKVLDLNRTVTGMISMLRRLVSEDIELQWNPGENLARVNIDPSQVDQILANLVVNAQDAISGSGKIAINTRNISLDEKACMMKPEKIAGHYVLLEISDTGCGIHPDVLAHMFEPFFTTKAIGKGTGLGLAMVYGIVKQNGGFIDVRSNLGFGSTFEIYLPQYVSASEWLPQESSNDLSTNGHATILLVEDEPMILDITAQMLKMLGYKVFSACSPNEALFLSAEYSKSIDLLITDVIMPESNGRELGDLLKIHHSQLKILYMSGYTADVIAIHGVTNEDAQFIQKPFTLEELDTKVRAILSDTF